jgi:hypothetical protein
MIGEEICLTGRTEESQKFVVRFEVWLEPVSTQ